MPGPKKWKSRKLRDSKKKRGGKDEKPEVTISQNEDIASQPETQLPLSEQTESEDNSKVEDINQAESEENSTVEDVNQTESEENSRGEDVNQTQSEEKSRVEDVNQTQSEENSAVEDVNQTQSEENSAVEDVNQTQSEEDSRAEGISNSSSPSNITSPVSQDTSASRRLLIACHLHSSSAPPSQDDVPPTTLSFNYQPTGPEVPLVLDNSIVWPWLNNGNGIQVIVEDPDQDQCVLLTIYQWILDEEFDPMVLPRGTILIVKNPWLVPFGDNNFGIWTDNPVNIDLYDGSFPFSWKPLDLSINEELGEISPEPCKDYKAKGDAFFLQRKYHSAIRAYSFAIKANPDNVVLWTHRSFCYLKVGRELEAVADADRALDLDPLNAKAISRKVVAICRLNEHEKVLRLLISNQHIVHSDSNLFNLNKSVVEILESGPTYLSFLRNDAKPVDIGEHLLNPEYSVLVEAGRIPGKGRGLILKKDVKAGQLILASRTFDQVCQDLELSTVSNEKARTRFRHRAVASIAERLKAHPQLRAHLYQLYAGPEYEPIDPESVFDPEVQASLLVDMHRIERILYFNAYGPHVYNYKYNNKIIKRILVALSILPSFINHSCVGTNVRVTEHGDFTIVVAKEDIKAGTELLVSYFEGLDLTWEERKLRCDRYGFTCTCAMCELKL